MVEPSKKSLIKSIGAMSLITLVSRILGLVREMVRAALLGTSYYSDAFTLAFSLPNLFRRLTAEGIMSTAFIPIFCQIKEEQGQKQAFDFARNFFWLASLVLSLFTALFILLAPWLVEYVFAAGFTGQALDLTVLLTQLMFGYILLISLAAVGQGVLNSLGTFWVSSLTPVLLNLVVIGVALAWGRQMVNPTYAFALGVMLGGLLQLLFHLPFTRRVGLRLWGSLNFKDPHLREAGRLMLPALFGAGIYQINIVISNLIATGLAEGSLSSLNFSNRLLELVLGVFVVSVATAMLPRFSALFIQNRLPEIRDNLSASLRLVAFVSLPVTLGCLVVAEEMVELLFLRGRFDQHSLEMTAGALKLHILGLVFIGWNRVLVSCFQAGKFMKRPVQISAWIMLANLGGAYLLSRSGGHLGIALANSLSQMLQCLLLLWYLKDLKLGGGLGVFLDRRLLKIALSGGIMWVALAAAKPWVVSWSSSASMHLLLLLPLGIFSFVLPSLLLKNSELAQLWQLLKKKGRGQGGPK